MLSQTRMIRSPLRRSVADPLTIKKARLARILPQDGFRELEEANSCESLKLDEQRIAQRVQDEFRFNSEGQEQEEQALDQRRPQRATTIASAPPGQT